MELNTATDKDEGALTLDIIPDSSNPGVREWLKKLPQLFMAHQILLTLGVVGRYQHIATNATAKDATVLVKVQNGLFNLIKCLDAVSLMLQTFQSGANNILEKLKVAYLYLLDGFPDFAMTDIEAIVKDVGTMKASTEKALGVISETEKSMQEAYKFAQSKNGHDAKLASIEDDIDKLSDRYRRISEDIRRAGDEASLMFSKQPRANPKQFLVFLKASVMSYLTDWRSLLITVAIFVGSFLSMVVLVLAPCLFLMRFILMKRLRPNSVDNKPIIPIMISVTVLFLVSCQFIEKTSINNIAEVNGEGNMPAAQKEGDEYVPVAQIGDKRNMTVSQKSSEGKEGDEYVPVAQIGDKRNMTVSQKSSEGNGPKVNENGPVSQKSGEGNGPKVNENGPVAQKPGEGNGPEASANGYRSNICFNITLTVPILVLLILIVAFYCHPNAKFFEVATGNAAASDFIPLQTFEGRNKSVQELQGELQQVREEQLDKLAEKHKEETVLGDAQLAKCFLRKALNDLKSVSGILKQSTGVVETWYKECKDIIEPTFDKKIKKAVDIPEEQRKDYWNSMAFKKEVIGYYCRWKALQEYCATLRSETREKRAKLESRYTENLYPRDAVLQAWKAAGEEMSDPDVAKVMKDHEERIKDGNGHDLSKRVNSKTRETRLAID